MPSALALARAARGLTQAELAAKSGVSQAYLSKAEKGAVELTGSRLIDVASALGYPVEFFIEDMAATPAPTACAFPRKRNSLPVSAEKQVRAVLEVTRMQVDALLDGVDEAVPPVSLERRAVEDEDWISPAEMAAHIRARAGVPTGPITDLTELLERMGVVVVVRDLGNRRIDALGEWPPDHRPLMLVNVTAPPDRRRFTLAHELGHTVLHASPRLNQESEADQFAAELLLPAVDGRRLFTADLNLARLADLKARWGVSMAALARRAWDLGVISDYRYRQLNIDLSAGGYRIREPVPLQYETPSLLSRAIDHRQAAGEELGQLASRARMTDEEFSSMYLEAAG